MGQQGVAKRSRGWRRAIEQTVAGRAARSCRGSARFAQSFCSGTAIGLTSAITTSASRARTASPGPRRALSESRRATVPGRARVGRIEARHGSPGARRRGGMGDMSGPHSDDPVRSGQSCGRASRTLTRFRGLDWGDSAHDVRETWKPDAGRRCRRTVRPVHRVFRRLSNLVASTCDGHRAALGNCHEGAQVTT